MTNRSNDVILEIRCDQAGPDLSDSSWLANCTYTSAGNWQEKRGEVNFTMLLGDSSEYETKHE